MMKRLSTALLGLLLLASPAAADNMLVQRAVEGFVQPAYSAFHADTGQLREAVGRLCAAPGEPALADARQRFVDAAGAWSAAETIRFGPVTQENRLERILFWPDRKGIGLKQVQAAIATEDPSAANVASLAGKSVAMQGLGALEFVLFGTDSESLASAPGAYRCRYGSAIATNLDAMAGELDAAWRAEDGIAYQWSHPRPDNPLYRSDDEAMTELFNVFVHGLELIRDVRLNGFLGEKAEEDRPKQAIYWRSGATLPSIASGLDGLARLFGAADFSPLLAGDNSWLPGSIAFEFANARTALETAGGVPVAEVLNDPQRRQKLDYARIVTSSLSELFGVRLAGALNLTAGFSSLDGD